MAWIVAILIGALIGFIASLITGGGGGLIWDVIVGILGALLGKWLFFNVLHIGSAAATGTFSFWGILWAVVGAVIVIAVLKALKIR